MPLGFSLSRRGRNKRGPSPPTSPALKASTSLPDLGGSSGMGPWPPALVHAPSLAVSPPVYQGMSQGASKTSLQLDRPGPVSFHRPFRSAAPPSSFHSAIPVDTKSPSAGGQHRRPPPPPSPAPTIPHKRPRVPPTTFNLLCAGALGSGKSSLLSLLLSTLSLSPSSSPSQHKSISDFITASLRPTRELRTAAVEVEQGVRRYLLTVIDTPGLDLAPGKELEFDRAVSKLVRYQEGLMAETLDMENRVIRQFTPDHQVHICLYLIDPSTVLRRRPQKLDLTAPLIPKSRYDFITSPPADPTSTDEDALSYPLSMHPLDLRAIHRLSVRYTVLPLIGKSDCLTERQLEGVKEAVRVGLREAGLGGGVWEPEEAIREEEGVVNGRTNGNGKEKEAEAEAGHPESSDDERTPRHVIRIRPTAPETGRRRSRSLSRVRSAREGERFPPDRDDEDELLGAREDIAAEKRKMAGIMPFAVIAPELTNNPSSSMINSNGEANGNGHAPGLGLNGEVNGNGSGMNGNAPGAEKGKWVRKYRWGVIDVLDPAHCDFVALRRTVLELWFNPLKVSTRRQLYEKFRTEKLLVRRATRDMSEEERNKILGI